MNPGILQGLNDYASMCRLDAAKWYVDLETGAERKSDVPRSLLLIVSEITEAMEGHRKDLMDDKLPHRKMFDVELADALIRIFDLAGDLGVDLDGAFWEKRKYNASRQDHTHEVRSAAGGKKF